MISKSELACKRKLGKTIVAKRKILKGEVISSQDVVVKVVLTSDIRMKRSINKNMKETTENTKLLRWLSLQESTPPAWSTTLEKWPQGRSRKTRV